MSGLADIWCRLSDDTRGQLALRFQGRDVSYGALEAHTLELAERVRSRLEGADPPVVGLLCGNSPEFVFAYLAVTALGGCVQPVDLRLSDSELVAQLKDSGARVLLAGTDVMRRVGEQRLWQDGAVVLPLEVETEARSASSASSPRLPVVTADAVAELMYTAGTTAMPKGVLRTQGNVLAAVDNAIQGFGYLPDERLLITMPLSHSSALNSQLLPVLKVKGSVILADGLDPHQVVSQLRDDRITAFRAVPTMWQLLLSLPEFRAGSLPDLKTLINSSATILPSQVMQLRQRFPGVRILNSYGLTEASTSTILRDDELLDHPGSIGRPIGGVEMCIRVGERDAKPDEIGEILIRGPHVFKGYLGRPDETRGAFVDGWLRTGDMGWVDGDGFYYLAGRETDLITCGGYKVSPPEVEDVILTLPGVREVVAVGMPHRMLGEVVKAVIVTAPGADVTERQVIHHCMSRLANYKVPFRVIIAHELPKSSVGKVLRTKIKEIF